MHDASLIILCNYHNQSVVLLEDLQQKCCFSIFCFATIGFSFIQCQSQTALAEDTAKSVDLSVFRITFCSVAVNLLRYMKSTSTFVRQITKRCHPESFKSSKIYINDTVHQFKGGRSKYLSCELIIHCDYSNRSTLTQP